MLQGKKDIQHANGLWYLFLKEAVEKENLIQLEKLCVKFHPLLMQHITLETLKIVPWLIKIPVIINVLHAQVGDLFSSGSCNDEFIFISVVLIQQSMKLLETLYHVRLTPAQRHKG